MAIASYTETQPNRTETETETHIAQGGESERGAGEGGGGTAQHTQHTAQHSKSKSKSKGSDEQRDHQIARSTYVQAAKAKYLYLRVEQPRQSTNQHTGRFGVGDCVRTVAGLRVCTAQASRLICLLAHCWAGKLEAQRMHSGGTKY